MHGKGVFKVPGFVFNFAGASDELNTNGLGESEMICQRLQRSLLSLAMT
jgi:hypothetical protein